MEGPLGTDVSEGTRRLSPASGHWALIVGALVVLLLTLLLPGKLKLLVPDTFLRLPLELPLLVLLFVCLPQRVQLAVRLLVVTLLGLIVLLRLADMGTRVAFERRFNPLLDIHLVHAGWNLASGSLGRWQAMVAAGVSIGALILLCVLLYQALRVIGEVTGRQHRLLRSSAMVAILAVLAGLWLQPRTAIDLRVQADLAADVGQRVSALQRAVADQTVFAPLLRTDPLSGAKPGFATLADRDVIVIFIESYGRGFLERRRFRDQAIARLSDVDKTIRGAGLHARSGWSRSSVRGGRSWLTHATFMSGLRITNHGRFERLVTSKRTSLNRLFEQAGWTTAGVMPAITLDWPEGDWYGFQQFHGSRTLGYRGQNFEWVTMPDQYTLAAFEEKIRQPSKRPLMAQIALISSHAPWTPLPLVLPWEAVGDGAIFDGTKRQGDLPREVWADPERIRDQYALSLEYSLEVLAEYLARFADDSLFILLGDHAPLPVINGEEGSYDVPIHVVSSDETLLQRLPAANFSDGMVPDTASATLPMEAMRELLATRFEAAAQTQSPVGLP